MFRDVRSKLPLSLALICLASLAGRRAAEAQSSHRVLDSRVQLELTGVTDSSEYLVYRYRIINPSASLGGVAHIIIDLAASPGTGRRELPFTGRRMRGGGDSADHVPFGAIAPEKWRMLVSSGLLYWYAPNIGTVVGDSVTRINADSVPPGGSRDGFGLRSPYLPGIRRFGAEPTYLSCCSRPIPNSVENEYPSPDSFRVRGATVAPMNAPENVHLDLILSQLREVCGALHWIPDAPLCGRLQRQLVQAAAADRRGDRQSATTALRAFLDELEAQYTAGAVYDNAYWLLKLNAEYLRRQL
jgi:hypothetical protein